MKINQHIQEENRGWFSITLAVIGGIVVLGVAYFALLWLLDLGQSAWNGIHQKAVACNTAGKEYMIDTRGNAVGEDDIIAACGDQSTAYFMASLKQTCPSGWEITPPTATTDGRLSCTSSVGGSIWFNNP